MCIGDYVQQSVHGKDPVTSTYGHNCEKDVNIEFNNRTCQKNTFSVNEGGGIGILYIK